MTISNILMVLLAGGRSSRMGGDNKALLKWHDTTLIGHLQDKLSDMNGQTIISANHDLSLLESYGLPIIEDADKSYAGPLAGLLAAMNWAAIHEPSTNYIALCSCDTPFISKDLYQILIEAGRKERDVKIILPQSGGHIHPLHGLWSTDLREALQAYLEKGGRRVQQFSQTFTPLRVPFDFITLTDGTNLDPFTNINSPKDYEKFKNIAV